MPTGVTATDSLLTQEKSGTLGVLPLPAAASMANLLEAAGGRLGLVAGAGAVACLIWTGSVSAV
jgi:hypothetical protein